MTSAVQEDHATDDTQRQAAMLEAETLQHSGDITLMQAKARIRDRQASPVARLALQRTLAANSLAAALRELHSVWVEGVRAVCGHDALHEVYDWMAAEKKRRAQVARDAQEPQFSAPLPASLVQR